MSHPYVALTQEQARDILDVLIDASVGEECFASEIGREKCLHCKMNKVIDYLFDGGLDAHESG